MVSMILKRVLCMPEDAEHEIFDDILQFDVTCNGKKAKNGFGVESGI